MGMGKEGGCIHHKLNSSKAALKSIVHFVKKKK